MIVVVALARLIPGVSTSPSWVSLLLLGSLAMAVFAAILLAVMPAPIRKGWAALRGREPLRGAESAA
jgi:hypothetical protein